MKFFSSLFLEGGQGDGGIGIGGRQMGFENCLIIEMETRKKEIDALIIK